MFQQQLLLIWFVATQPGAYVPIYPIWIVADEQRQLQFVVVFDSAQRYAPLGVVDNDQRRNVEHVTHQLLRQRVPGPGA